jgi:hypothetical protein
MGLISNGTTLLDSGALDSGVATGSMILLSTITASSSSTVNFTSGIDSTYKEYIFKFINVHPSVDNHIFEFQGNASGGSGFNETITSSSFRAYHNENGTSTALEYTGNDDLEQGTDYQHLANGISNDNDGSLSGELHLFDPSSTTFVKFFNARVNFYEAASTRMIVNHYTAGYFNTTSAIDEISFKMASGNIDSGTFKLYGIK